MLEPILKNVFTEPYAKSKESEKVISFVQELMIPLSNIYLNFFLKFCEKLSPEIFYNLVQVNLNLKEQ